LNTATHKTCTVIVVLLMLVAFSTAKAQTVLKGSIIDRITGETLIGANIQIKGIAEGCTADMNGNFIFTTTKPLPVTLLITYLGYQAQEYTVESEGDKLKFKLISSNFQLKAVEITALRISDKQRESALTMESMNVLGIKETPATNFYEGLGALKEVDVTSASIGFKIINTRGFNSTSPVRSLQIIDGVDNQAPGLNFSLGNFLGSSELDVKKVDLIIGASSAFYGPNAFNGVISMETKDPFQYPGLSIAYKMGERNLHETSVRYAHVFSGKNSIPRWAFKFNASYMKADDWVANNLDAVYDSEAGANNSGGYDAVNRYGDESPIYFNSPNNKVNLPGLNIFYRTGYEEQDIVNYDSENLKLNFALHHQFKDSSQFIVSSNFGTGTTVYQGDNRYSLNGILFYQNKLEYKSDKGFIRAYATHEDAGKSYDAVFTALLLQDMAKDNGRWSSDYGYYWATMVAPKVKDLPNFPKPQIIDSQVVYDFDLADEIMMMYSDSLQMWHNMVSTLADLGVSPPGDIVFNDNMDRLVPGTDRYNEALNDITSKTSFSEGGSRFWDKSALYHIHGERKFKLESSKHAKLDIITGGNFRLYTPNSRGTIFKDTTDRITNQEYGAYIGLEKRLANEKLRANVTVRIDKNENFPFVISPAASLVYNVNENTVARFSFSSATRNPTLQDQYLYYNAGRAILLGNLNGFDSLVTIESARTMASSQNPEDLVYFNVAPIIPEKVKTIEAGFRSLLANQLYVDASYYYSFYKDFIGYNSGLDAVVDPLTNLFNPAKTQAYRIAANATDVVTTQGASAGVNYYFKKFFTISGNYSWNKLDLHGSDDPIIPAFNTPEHKFNIGITGRDITTRFKLSKKENSSSFFISNFGFSINYKWIQGFLYEGSPQFTGEIPTYDILNAQVSKYIPSIHTTMKIGASNSLNNKQFQVYGGPRIGGLIYFSLLFEPNIK
jgi:iron complex outermembrane recepter protein